MAAWESEKIAPGQIFEAMIHVYSTVIEWANANFWQKYHYSTRSEKLINTGGFYITEKLPNWNTWQITS